MGLAGRVHRHIHFVAQRIIARNDQLSAAEFGVDRHNGRSQHIERKAVVYLSGDMVRHQLHCPRRTRVAAVNLIHIRRAALVGRGVVTAVHAIRALVSEQVVEGALLGFVHELTHTRQVEKLQAELNPGHIAAILHHDLPGIESRLVSETLLVAVVLRGPAPDAARREQVVFANTPPRRLHGLEILRIARHLVEAEIAQQIRQQLVDLAVARFHHIGLGREHLAQQVQLRIGLAHGHDTPGKIEVAPLARPLVKHHDGFEQRRGGHSRPRAVFGQVVLAVTERRYQQIAHPAAGVEHPFVGEERLVGQQSVEVIAVCPDIPHIFRAVVGFGHEGRSRIVGSQIAVRQLGGDQALHDAVQRRLELFVAGMAVCQRRGMEPLADVFALPRMLAGARLEALEDEILPGYVPQAVVAPQIHPFAEQAAVVLREHRPPAVGADFGFAFGRNTGIEIRIFGHHACPDRFAPFVEHAFQLLGLFGHPGGKVVLFADVLRQVVELHGAVLIIFDQLVVPVTDRAAGTLQAVVAVMREMPENGTVLHLLLPEQRRNVHALGLAVAGKRRPRQAEERRIEIDADHRLVAFAGLRSGSLHDHRHAQAALVHPPLAAAQRKHRTGVGRIELSGQDDAVGTAVIGGRHTAVVGEKDDHRILIEPQLLEFGNDASHTLVHALDHRRKFHVVLDLLDLHPAVRQGLVRGIGRIVQAAQQLLGRSGIGIVGVSFQNEGRQLRRRHRLQFPAVFLHQVRTALNRIVHGKVGHEEEKRFVPVRLDIAERLVRKTVGEVFALFTVEAVHAERSHVAAGGPPLQVAVRDVHVEAVLLGCGARFTQMPLADDGRMVAVVVQCLGDGRHSGGKVLIDLHVAQLLEGKLPAAGQPVGHVDRGRIAPRQDARTGRRGDVAGRVGIGETHAVTSQRVDVGRFVETAAERGDVAPAEVVHQEEDHIGPLRSVRRTAGIPGSPLRPGGGSASCRGDHRGIEQQRPVYIILNFHRFICFCRFCIVTVIPAVRSGNAPRNRDRRKASRRKARPAGRRAGAVPGLRGVSRGTPCRGR